MLWHKSVLNHLVIILYPLIRSYFFVQVPYIPNSKVMHNYIVLPYTSTRYCIHVSELFRKWTQCLPKLVIPRLGQFTLYNLRILVLNHQTVREKIYMYIFFFTKVHQWFAWTYSYNKRNNFTTFTSGRSITK